MKRVKKLLRDETKKHEKHLEAHFHADDDPFFVIIIV